MVFIDPNKTIITFPSAEIYWQTGNFPKADPSEPVHIIVSKASLRKKGPGYICHVLSDTLPDNSFIEIAPDTFIICPELCFILAANYYPLYRLILLGNNLCATYYTDELSQYGQQHRTPVTSKESISKYLEKCSNIKGLKKARTGIKYVIDNSNSPMESKLAVLMNMPIAYGGYALITPRLNQEIFLSNSGKSFLGRDYCQVDAIWEKEHIVLEYDSSSVHLSPEQFHYDKKRASAIGMSGYKVISVTNEHLKSFRAVENLFESLRFELGMRKEQNRFDKYLEKRLYIIQDLILNIK